MHQFFYICVFNCRVGGGGGGELGLCRPRVISRDQASLMSSGPSRGTQASYTALPTPSSLSLGTFRLHTAPCWQIWPQHDIKIVLPWPPHSQVVIWYNIFIHSFFLICNWVILSIFLWFKYSITVNCIIYSGILPCAHVCLCVFSQGQNPTERHGADISWNEWRLHQWELLCHLVPHRKPFRLQVLPWLSLTKKGEAYTTLKCPFGSNSLENNIAQQWLTIFFNFSGSESVFPIHWLH